MMPEQFENGRIFDGENSLQDFGAKEMYLHPKNRSVSSKKRRKMFCFHLFRVFLRWRFQNVTVRVPFSKSTFAKSADKNVPFSREQEAYPSHFSPFSKYAGIERTQSKIKM